MNVSFSGEVLTCVLRADFQISIFADPVYRGDWPASVKERAPPNLLRITPDLARPSHSALCSAAMVQKACCGNSL